MPEKWIESAGPNANVLSKAAFEKWFNNYYKGGTTNNPFIKETAWAAWEHQRLKCSDLIRQIMSIVKET